MRRQLQALPRRRAQPPRTTVFASTEWAPPRRGPPRKNQSPHRPVAAAPRIDAGREESLHRFASGDARGPTSRVDPHQPRLIERRLEFVGGHGGILEGGHRAFVTLHDRDRRGCCGRRRWSGRWIEPPHACRGGHEQPSVGRPCESAEQFRLAEAVERPEHYSADNAVSIVGSRLEIGQAHSLQVPVAACQPESAPVVGYRGDVRPLDEPPPRSSKTVMRPPRPTARDPSRRRPRWSRPGIGRTGPSACRASAPPESHGEPAHPP